MRGSGAKTRRLRSTGSNSFEPLVTTSDRPSTRYPVSLRLKWKSRRIDSWAPEPK